MKFGKLHDLSVVDFSLPPDSARTVRILNAASKGGNSTTNFYLGATGWSNKEWIGRWYPPKTKPTEFLRHYSQLCNTIEFNTTHYRIPDSDLVIRWRENARQGFVFCPKIPQQISHRSKLRAEEPTLRFAETIAEFREKLGPCFIQLPDHHGPNDLHLIRNFLKMWPREALLHWELRHPAWFSSEGGPSAEGWDALEAAGHGTVITDVAGRRDALHLQLTTPALVLRFVGNGLHPTDYARTDAWVTRITDWTNRGLKSAHIFIHQPEENQVPGFIGYWAKALNRALGANLHIPTLIPVPIQGTLF